MKDKLYKLVNIYTDEVVGKCRLDKITMLAKNYAYGLNYSPLRWRLA